MDLNRSTARPTTPFCRRRIWLVRHHRAQKKFQRKSAVFLFQSPQYLKNTYVTSGIQTVTIPQDGYWRITAYGARGGYGRDKREAGSFPRPVIFFLLIHQQPPFPFQSLSVLSAFPTFIFLQYRATEIILSMCQAMAPRHLACSNSMLALKSTVSSRVVNHG